MNVNLKIHNPTTATENFLKEVSYPYDCWTGTMLRQNAFMIWLHTDSRETVGYVWFTMVPDCYRTFEFHIAIDPKFQRRWLSRSTYSKLVDVAKLLDARVVLIYALNNERFLNILKLLGWTIVPPFALLEVS